MIERLAKAELEVLSDPEALARRAADWLTERARAKAGTFALALSGGSSPRRLYQHLAEPPWRDAFPWARTHWFWGDERFVPPDDARSNYRMAREALLASAPIPRSNIHPVPTTATTPEEAASSYERTLKAFYGADQLDPERPLFDITLLGLGPEGHTASLFPGASALDERTHWVTSVIGAKPEARITLTYPTLESTRAAVFLVMGEEKRDILARFLRGEADLPASGLHPLGVLRVFADNAAAGPL